MIKLCDFIHVQLDKSTPHAVTAALVDLSKAYNSASHHQVIEDLHAMHAPGWLLAILISYLTQRQLIVRYKQTTSTPRTLDSGATQGCKAGNIIFIVRFNGALLRPPIPRPITGNRAMQAKYIDDQTVASSINLKNSLKPDHSIRPKPLNFHERLGLRIDPDEDVLQSELNRFHTFVSQNHFSVNQKKSVVMLFSKSRTLDFPPEYRIGQSEILSEKSCSKLLGVKLNNQLTYDDNTQYIVRRTNKKLWLLRRLRQIGLDERTVLKYWVGECRPRLEYLAPLWTGSLTINQSRTIDAVQRSALAICLDGGWGLTYSEALARAGLERLDTRRLKLARRWGEATSKLPGQDFFVPNPRLTINPRSAKKTQRFLEPSCRTNRRKRSAIPYITQLMNQSGGSTTLRITTNSGRVIEA